MTTVIKFWLMPNAAFESKQTIDYEIALFHKLNPNIEVRCEYFSWSRAWFQLMEAVKEKSGPDIMQLGSTWVRTFAYLGALKKLDSRKIDSDKFIPLFFDMCNHANHLWAVPWFCDARVLFYRKDFLEKTESSVDELDNWDSFAKVCLKVGKLHTSSKKISPLGFSGYKDPSILQDVASLIWSHGGSFMSDNGRNSAINSPESKLGIKFFLDQISSNNISRTSLSQGVGEIVENFFFHDEYAFLLSSSWPLQEYLNPASKRFVGRNKLKKFGIALVPQGPAGRFNFSGGSALAVSSFANYPEEAWKFLDFLTSRDPLQRYCQKINMLPARKELSITLDHLENAQDVFHKATNLFGRSYTTHPVWASIEQIMVNGFAESTRDFLSSDNNQSVFFQNLSVLSREIDLILSVFGE